MARGGKREGSGRKSGAAQAKTRAIANGIMLDGNETPLEVIIKLMRNATNVEDKLKAAIAAAPYVHPRLAAVDHSGSVAFTHEDALGELERAIDDESPRVGAN